MVIDPVVLSSITAAVALVGQEYAKGVSSEAGKATWRSIKQLFDWHSDLPLAEIPEKLAKGLEGSPDALEKLIDLLKKDRSGIAAALIQNVSVSGGKVVFAQTIETLNKYVVVGLIDAGQGERFPTGACRKAQCSR